MKRRKVTPLQKAINEDAYLWLQQYGPRYLAAIEKSIEMGMSPDDVYAEVSQGVGPERQALALRCKQAALYLSSNGS